MQSENKTKQIIATLAVLVVVVVIVFGAKSFSSKPASQVSAATGSGNTPVASSGSGAMGSTATTTSTSSSGSSYKDGTYSADGSFNTPGGIQAIGVQLTVQNDAVTSASITDETTDGDSEAYLQQFLSGYRSYVVGQKVGNIQLYGVSGASLTSRGFNSALAQIKKQAKA